MNKFLMLLSILCCWSSIITAQENQPIDQRKIEQLMREKIMVLKNGALLVRLQTKENSINALNTSGNSEKAKEVEEKQIAYNKEVIAAFRKEFKFCPVYFFSSKHSENVAAGKLQLVVFYNDSLQEESEIKLSQSDFLTAEFGPLDPDTASYYDGYYYSRSGSSLEKKNTEYGASNMGIEALKIMNSKFIQLTDPFPYYVRTFESLPVERKLSKTVGKMNEKLMDYYNMFKGK